MREKTLFMKERNQASNRLGIQPRLVSNFSKRYEADDAYKIYKTRCGRATVMEIIIKTNYNCGQLKMKNLLLKVHAVSLHMHPASSTFTRLYMKMAIL
jgi:hypothetical protein